MDDLQVDSELAAMIADDQDSDAATTGLEGFGEARPEVGLINNGDGLFNITGLGHRNNGALLKIKDTILLEDWTKHSLDDNTWAWV